MKLAQKKHLRNEVAKRVKEQVLKESVPGNLETVVPVTEAVLEEVVPRIDHATNTERWWQSRVILGSILVVLSRLLAHFGYAIPAELHGDILNLVVAFGPYAGVALIGWGRLVASKPLFSGWFKRA